MRASFLPPLTLMPLVRCCFAICALVFASSACTAHEVAPPASTGAAKQPGLPQSSDAPARSEQAPTVTEGPGTQRELPVAGFENALFFTPGGMAPRPLVVAAHGAGGTPEWECDYWRRLTADRVFVLCLRGTPLGGQYSGFFYRDHHALSRELGAAERAARAADSRILAHSGVYAGFSQGASMGAAILHERAAAFPYAVLIEGFTSWNVSLARRFLKAGGERVLLACGTKQCGSVAKPAAHWLETAGGQARLELVEGAGHTQGPPITERIRAALPWLLAGDVHWQ